MSHDDRARSASVPDSNPEVGVGRDGACAVGTSPPAITSDDRREALRRLIGHSKMIRRTDGSYGTTHAELMTNAMARHLKAKKLACPGFNHDIYPTTKGRKYLEESDA